MDKSMQGSSIFGSRPVKNSESAMRGFNTFGVTRIEPSNSFTKLKLKATDKLINFNEFGYICEDAPLTRAINPKVVEKSTLKDVDFSGCTTLTELCDLALKELIDNGADSLQAQLAIVGFILWWGKRYNGVSPLINYANNLLIKIGLIYEYSFSTRPSNLGHTLHEVEKCMERALLPIVFSEYFEQEVSENKSSLFSNLKRQVAKLDDMSLNIIVGDLSRGE